MMIFFVWLRKFKWIIGKVLSKIINSGSTRSHYKQLCHAMQKKNVGIGYSLLTRAWSLWIIPYWDVPLILFIVFIYLEFRFFGKHNRLTYLFLNLRAPRPISLLQWWDIWFLKHLNLNDKKKSKRWALYLKNWAIYGHFHESRCGEITNL